LVVPGPQRVEIDIDTHGPQEVAFLPVNAGPDDQESSFTRRNGDRYISAGRFGKAGKRP